MHILADLYRMSNLSDSQSADKVAIKTFKKQGDNYSITRRAKFSLRVAVLALLKGGTIQNQGVEYSPILTDGAQ